MSPERGDNEETLPSIERTAESARELVDLEAESLGTYERAAQQNWADGFTAMSRVLLYATTIPAGERGANSENNPI